MPTTGPSFLIRAHLSGLCLIIYVQREAIFSGQLLQQPDAFCPPAGMHGTVLGEIVHLIMRCKWPEAGIGPRKLTCSSVHTASAMCTPQDKSIQISPI